MWLCERHDCNRLAKLTVTGFQANHVLTVSPWASPYIHLTSPTTTRTFDQLSDIIDTDEATELDRHQIESKPLRAGTTIALYGTIRLEEGEPVIYGTDETPLVLSEQGFDSLPRPSDAR